MNRRGFTLIELLIVISIIAILSSIILSSVSVARKKADDSVRVQDFRQFKLALSLYYDTYNRYPCGDSNDGSANNPGGTADSNLSAGFINHTHGLTVTNCQSYPDDPPNGIYPDFYLKYEPKDPVNVPPYFYLYFASADRQSYLIMAPLETNTGLMANDGGTCANEYEIWGGNTRIAKC